MITCPVKIVSIEAIGKKKRDYNGKSRAWGDLPELGIIFPALAARTLTAVRAANLLPF